MIEWLHTHLKEKRESLVRRLHKLQPTVTCSTPREMTCFLSFRKSPSTMRKRRSSELHVAEQEPGNRKFFSLVIVNYYEKLAAEPSSSIK